MVWTLTLALYLFQDDSPVAPPAAANGSARPGRRRLIRFGYALAEDGRHAVKFSLPARPALRAARRTQMSLFVRL